MVVRLAEIGPGERMFAILHSAAVKKSLPGNTISPCRRPAFRGCIAPASVGPTAQRVGGHVGDEGKAAGKRISTALLFERALIKSAMSMMATQFAKCASEPMAHVKSIMCMC
jgi:hypothetical protein